MFMQENTLILEIMTPHTLNNYQNQNILSNTTKELHYMYNLITFLKNQTYISIPNTNNDVNSIIYKLNSLGLKQ